MDGYKSNADPNADLNAIPNAKVDAESVIRSNSKIILDLNQWPKQGIEKWN